MQKEILSIKNLFVSYPHLVTEWDEDANLSLALHQIKQTSTKRAWWKCPRGHSWRARIVDRTKPKPLHCPACIVAEIKLKKPLTKTITKPLKLKKIGRPLTKTISKPLSLKKIKKSLAIKYPQIAREWHPTKNSKLTPKDVTYSSHKEIWWQCNIYKEHIWKARVQSRTYSKTSCLYCTKNLDPEIFSQALSPHLLKEWDSSKNGEPFSKEIRSVPTQKVWWKCEKGHGWQESFYRRYKLKTNCPHCIKTKKSLSVNYPALLDEWDHKKNLPLGIVPDNISTGSQKIVWWRCKNSHSWQCTIPNRMQTGRRSNCPKCRTLFFQHPEVAREWHPTRNGSLTPDIIHSGSVKKVWWKCKKGHTSYTSVNYKVKTNKCFICVGVRSPSISLDIKYPLIAKEWHPTKNGLLTPKDVGSKSNKRVWWLCEKGHEWKGFISSRSGINGELSKCPKCRSLNIL